MTNSTKFKIAEALLAGLAVVMMGQACEKPMKSKETESASTQPDTEPGGNQPDDYVETPDGVEPLIYAKTTRIATSEEILPSLVSIAGIEKPSDQTATRMNTKYRLLFSETGETEGINAPMWMNVVNLSGDVCSDLMTKEKSLTSDQRRIFIDWNFNAGPSSLPAKAIPDAVRRLARSAWARSETTEELKMISEALKAFTGTDKAETQASAVFLCTAIMASLETQKR